MRKRTLSRTVLVCAMALVSTLHMRADDASKRAKLHEMFLLAHIDRTMTQAFNQQAKQFPKLLQAMFPGATITPEEQKDIDAFLQKISGIVQEQANWTTLEPQFTDIYASVYSEPEIDGLLAFYKSPAGQAFVSKQPELLEKSQGLTQALAVQMQPRLQAAVLQFVQQMQQKYPSGSPGAK